MFNILTCRCLPFIPPLIAVAISLCARPVPAAAETTAPDIAVVAVKGGCFEMGDAFGDGGLDERPLHRVCLDDFSIGKFEVTRSEWQALMGNAPPRSGEEGNFPVEGVNWNDAQEFIRRLNAASGKKWRLPTEAEWEYAARGGGKMQRFAGANSADELGVYAWHEGNSEMKTHPVGTRKPNGLALYDMSGNVWEWVQDRYDRNYYRQSPLNNPKGDPFGINRIIRGGSATGNRGFLRTTYRDYVAPDIRGSLFGLRLVLDDAPTVK